MPNRPAPDVHTQMWLRPKKQKRLNAHLLMICSALLYIKE